MFEEARLHDLDVEVAVPAPHAIHLEFLAVQIQQYV
jgi:hypothetical protein